MPVYVDKLRDHGWRHGPSCHMIADSVEELVAFAVSIGLRAEWFQPKSSPHFDLTAEGRRMAVRHGAIELAQRQLVTKLREIREKAYNRNWNRPPVRTTCGSGWFNAANDSSG